MERSKRTLWFWVLVLTAVVMPATGDARVKQLYRAKIFSGSSGVGSSIITVSPAVSYLIRSVGLPNQAVQRVSLITDDGAGWEVLLCENGNPIVGDCSYNASGEVDIEGAVNAPLLGLAGITGGTFFDALRLGHLFVLFDSGADGSGRFVRII